jgi:hypothetical protein
MYKWSPMEVISTLIDAGSMLILSSSGKLPCTSQVRVYPQADGHRQAKHHNAECAQRWRLSAEKPCDNDKTMTAFQSPDHRMGDKRLGGPNPSH